MLNKLIKYIVQAVIILLVLTFWVAVTPIIVWIKPVHAKEVAVPLIMQCYAGNHTTMQRDFLKQHNETPLLQGVISGDDNKSLMYIFHNKDNAKWTFVYLGINGFYCIPFYGEGLKPVKGRKAYAPTY